MTWTPTAKVMKYAAMMLDEIENKGACCRRDLLSRFPPEGMTHDDMSLDLYDEGDEYWNTDSIYNWMVRTKLVYEEFDGRICSRYQAYEMRKALAESRKAKE